MANTLLRLTKKWISAVVLSMVWATSVYAQDDNAQIMEKLYTKIAQSVTVGTNTQAAGKSLLILANPGIAIDPALSPATNQDDRRALSRVLDRVPGSSWIYQDTTFTISSIYENVLDHHELPSSTITDAQKQDLKNADVTLFKQGNPAKGESDKYLAYKKYRQDWQTKVNDAELHRKPNGSLPPEFSQARQAALEDWKNLGFKNEIETALAKRDSLTALDPNLWFQQLSTLFTSSQESAGPDQFFPVGLYPSYSSWPTITGWATITLSSNEVHNLATTDHTSMGGSAGAGFGLWSFSAGASHTKDDAHTHSNVKDLALTMDVMRVNVDRPWLDGLVFQSVIWRWASDAPLVTKLISDGGHPPSGDVLMPYVPTAILIARNVKISGKFDDSDTTFHHDHTSVSGSAGWGPFAVSGHYEEDHTRNTFDSIMNADGITIPGIQIIGWYCEALPKSPNPNLSLNWPTHGDVATH